MTESAPVVPAAPEIFEDRYGRRYEVIREQLVCNPQTDKPLYVAVTVREVRVGSR